jgi:hypothetical protein
MTSSPSFLRRWSRLKLEGNNPSVPAAESKPVARALPVVETLDFDADFSVFLGDGVDGETRRNALRKLFMTEHYRVMDGLDVYIEDYSRPALLAPEMLLTLDHAQALLQKTDESAEASAPPADTPEQA